jgi:uncharacterized membrane protein YfcA
MTVHALVFPICLVLACILMACATFNCIVGSMFCGKYIENKALRKCFVIALLLVSLYCLQNLAMFLTKALELSAYLFLML